MNCKAVSANLAALIDEELEFSTACEVMRHLRSCSACRHEEREMRWLKKLLASAGPQVEPHELDPIFEARVQEWLQNPSLARSVNERGVSEEESRFLTVWQLAPVTLLALWLLTQTISPSSEAVASGSAEKRSKAFANSRHSGGSFLAGASAGVANPVVIPHSAPERDASTLDDENLMAADYVH